MRRLASWLKGWSDLAGHNEIPGYRELPWLSRKKLDHRALWRGLCSEGFWRAAAIVLMGVTVAHILGWHWDLTDWRQDLLRVLPILLATPWLAAARKRHLRAMLAVGCS